MTPDEQWDADNDVEREEEEDFDCPAFFVDGAWFCPAQGSEICDWDCPHG